MTIIKAMGIVLVLSLVIFLLVSTIYGIYLAFSASILLGLACLIIEPSLTVFGVAMLLFDKNIPEHIMQWLNNT